VCANNVLAHIDDLDDVMRGVTTLLAPDGLFVFEVQYLPDQLDDMGWSNVYHEHLDQHHLRPLVPFLKRHGLELFDAHRVATHGGSVRCYARRQRTQHAPEMSGRMRELLDAEPERLDFERVRHAVNRKMLQLVGLVSRLKREGRKIACFGAPAKLTTLMHTLGLDGSDVAFVVDDSPLKQGRYTPGHFIPIVSSDEWRARRPDYTIVTAWNMSAEVMAKHPEYRGKWIVLTPEVKVVE
jgi:hypothetical protein